MNSEPTRSLKPVNTYLAGVMYDDNYVQVPLLSIGETLRLSREPENPSDRNAIVVQKREGQTLGYIPRNLAAFLAPQMDREGGCVEAVITELSSDSDCMNCRIKVSFTLPEWWVNAQVPGGDFRSQAVEYF